MSIISNIHTAQVYDAKKSKPFDGQRLIVTIAKKDKDGNYGPHLQQTMATSVPVLNRSDIDWETNMVQDAATDYFKSLQNQIVASRLKEGKKEVTTEEISIAAIIDFINTDSTGDKWDAQRVALWFNDTLAEYIGVALIEKGFSEDKLESSLKAYEKLISECMSSRGLLPRRKAEAIKKAFDLVEDNTDATLRKFRAKIDKALEESNLDEALGL